MPNNTDAILQEKLSADQLAKLKKVNNQNLNIFIANYIELCNPSTIFICTDSQEDVAYIRQKALENKEEIALKIAGHSVHFDNGKDQARDKAHTAILVPKGEKLDEVVQTKDRDSALLEIKDILKNIMDGKELIVRFFCLGPTNSKFSIPAIQLTDSAYVAHSEDLLYRTGYEEFIRQGSGVRFFKFIHSQGELDERQTCKNLDKRRVYIDLADETVYSANTQYGGNTIGLKKLAMRLAINQGAREGWLTEHMLVMAIHGPGNRSTYFTGAFPSLCGKTSTAMLEGESIVGDDIAYLRNLNGEVRAVNVEKGIFGIIMGINSKDDPIQWEALHSPGEVIFSNILVSQEREAFWVGKDGQLPDKGRNHSGEWWPGKQDANGKEMPASHPNARFTVALDAMKNLDEFAHHPEGVKISGIVYGGRDGDTSVPVEEAFSWQHGVIMKGAALESETTAATLGKAGVRQFNPMSNLDFLPITIGRYVKINLDFGQKLKIPPAIFSVNYFLLDKNGRFLNEKNDKKVWYKWMELRVNRDVEALETPTGFIPKYQDLRTLYSQVLGKELSESKYIELFTIRIPENLQKIERIEKIYRGILETPPVLFLELKEQKQRLINARKSGDYLSPLTFA